MTVKEKMDQLSKRIDQEIKDANIQRPFKNHFDTWWKELNDRCGELYKEAGSEAPSPINNPYDAIKWLNDQIEKLHEFLSRYVTGNKKA